jgi:hypothetical protein
VGSEFGRTPFLQGKIEETKQWGRDHHPYAFTLWMAGGGVKPGLSYGAGGGQSVHLIRLRPLLP